MEGEYKVLTYHVNIVIEDNEELDGGNTSKDIEFRSDRDEVGKEEDNDDNIQVKRKDDIWESEGGVYPLPA
jgi:hypothetical protein